MAVAIVEAPYTYDINYYVNGALTSPIKLPFSLDPVDNPVEFTFNAITTGIIFPPLASIDILFYNNSVGVAPTYSPVDIVDGGNITIFGETFIARAQPQAGEFFISNNASLQQRQLSAESLTDAINQNLNLSVILNAQPIIDTVNNVFGVKLITKQTGTIYNFIPGTNIFVDILGTTTVNSTVSIVNSQDFNTAEQLAGFNYAVFLEVWTYNTQNFWGRRNSNNLDATLVAELSLPYRKDNQYTFDVSKILKSLLEIRIINRINVLNDTGKVNFDAGSIGVKSYYVKYGDKFSGGIDYITQLPEFDENNTYIRKYYSITNDDVKQRWAAHGAYLTNTDQHTLPHPAYWLHERENGTTNDYVPIKRLTNEPQYKLRRRVEEPELCYFYIHNDERTQANRHYRIKSTYHSLDLFTGDTIVISHITLISNGSGLFWVDLAPSKINFYNTDNAGRILYSDHVLQFSRGGTSDSNFLDYSEPWSYQWDLNTEPEYNILNKDKYFKVWFKNSFSVFDQFEFEGAQIRKVNTNFIDYQHSYHERINRSRKYSINARAKAETIYEITIDTGFIDIKHLEWLQELVTSTEWYSDSSYPIWDGNLVLGTKIDWVPLLLTAHDFNIDYNNRTFNLNCVFQIAIPENTITV